MKAYVIFLLIFGFVYGVATGQTFQFIPSQPIKEFPEPQSDTFKYFVELKPNSDSNIYSMVGISYDLVPNWVTDLACYVEIFTNASRANEKAVIRAGSNPGPPETLTEIPVVPGTTYTIIFDVDVINMKYSVTVDDGTGITELVKDYGFYQKPPFLRTFVHVPFIIEEWTENSAKLVDSGFVQSLSWNGYSMSSEGIVETGDFMGTLNVAEEPWIWSYDLEAYIYMPADSITEQGSWVYIPGG